MLARDLIEFEARLAGEFEQGKIRAPIHLSGGNEDQLIAVFKSVRREDWVFSTWRWHYHALLHGIPPEKVLQEVKTSGMNASFPEHRFYSSAIVGGILPIAVGVAAGLKKKNCGRKVWCFVGDMAATTGAFHESSTYASKQDLPITFVVEDNGLSTNAPTEEVWGRGSERKILYYPYERTFPHMGIGKWVQF
jgi:TPP-dependent pyruvate/acetoin dehydrogenase alpha subunit